MLELTDEIVASLRQQALQQACHDDRGSVPQVETLERAEAYFRFLVMSDE